VLPSPAEKQISPVELKDPLGEGHYAIADRIIWHYPSRILVRATGECFLFCRYCYRRSLLPTERAFIDDSSIHALIMALKTHSEIREVLISGGDPLTANDAQLDRLLQAIRSIDRPILIRICTRAPTVLPQRISENLTALLSRMRPLHIVLHINHPLELSEQFLEKAERLQKAGLPLHSQTVLLKGINDNIDTLVELFQPSHDTAFILIISFRETLQRELHTFGCPSRKVLRFMANYEKCSLASSCHAMPSMRQAEGAKVYLPGRRSRPKR